MDKKRRTDTFRVLVVDDDRDLAAAVAEYLAGEGLEVETAQTCERAGELLHGSRPPQLLISDLILPDGNGLDLIKKAGRLDPPVMSAIMTGYGSLQSALEAIHLGAYDYITKPFALGQLDVLLRNVQERIDLKAQSSRHEEQLTEMRRQLDIKTDEKLELQRVVREIRSSFDGLSGKMDTILSILDSRDPKPGWEAANSGEERILIPGPRRED